MTTTPDSQRSQNMQSRRTALQGGFSALPTLILCKPNHVDAAFSSWQRSGIATNTYPWFTFSKRQKTDFDHHADRLLKSIASTGIRGYEPIISAASDVTGLQAKLDSHGLTMESIYVNSVLHDAAKIQPSINNVLGIAQAVKPLGTSIIVTNPSPIRWGGSQNKSDDQLKRQAAALNQLGRRLRQQGQILAYHNHDAELRQGAREFHHMLTATDPANVKLCLDADWIYRGCGNSEVAVFDAVQHYHERIVELHLRQSKDGVWREEFEMQGDLNYRRLLDFLNSKGLAPNLVLEQAVEAQSPRTMTAVEAHQVSYNNLAKALQQSPR